MYRTGIVAARFSSGYAYITRQQPQQVLQWRRGELEVRLTSPANQPMVAASLGGSIGTGEEGLEAAVLRVTSLDEMSTLDPAIVGRKIVFIDKRTDMPMLALDHDGTDYFDYHHRVNDTLDKIGPGALNQNVAAMAIGAYVAATGKSDFGRLEPSDK